MLHVASRDQRRFKSVILFIAGVNITSYLLVPLHKYVSLEDLLYRDQITFNKETKKTYDENIFANLSSISQVKHSRK